MTKLKIILVGPKESGKTLISNIVIEMLENSYEQYEPTEGVRILETEASIAINSIQNSRIEIELWDCGGSQRYQSCWPIVQLDVQGIVFVCNPKIVEQLPELELLYDYFVTQNNLNDHNCMIFINEKSDFDRKGPDLPSRFDNVNKKTINAASNPNGIKSEFFNFIEVLLNDSKLR